MEVGVQAFAYVIRDGLDLGNLCRVNDRIRVRDRGLACSGFDGRADRDRPSARVDEPIDFFPGPTLIAWIEASRSSRVIRWTLTRQSGSSLELHHYSRQ
jgi:hypothetical protein